MNAMIVAVGLIESTGTRNQPTGVSKLGFARASDDALTTAIQCQRKKIACQGDRILSQ